MLELIFFGSGPLIAYTGDTNDNSDTALVFNLMESEGAEAVVHAGDADYNNDPGAFDDFVRSHWDVPNKPYLFVVGNHDDSSNYLTVAEGFLNDAGVSWVGQAGEKFACTIYGIKHVLVAPDVSGSGHEQFLLDNLNGSQWRVGVWHKLMRHSQIGGKGNESGWGVYNAARQMGAIVATGHEHSFEVTYFVDNWADGIEDFLTGDNTLRLGENFAFVSGLGGTGIRDQERCFIGDACAVAWRDIWTTTQGASEPSGFGVMFIDYNYQDNPCLARCYFKTVNGQIKSDFLITTQLGGCNCQYDLDNNGNVGTSDMLILLGNWDSYGTSDFLALLGSWGDC